MVTRPPRLGSLRVRFELGLMAFTPVMVLLAIRVRDTWLWVAFALPAAVSCAVAVGAWVVIRRANPEPYTFDSIEDLGGDILGHIGSYLLPVLVDVNSSKEEVVLTWLVLALIVHIHVATGRVYVNPLLYLLGYRIHRASTETGVAYYLLARTDVSTWTGSRRCKPLGSSVLVEHQGDPPQPSDGRLAREAPE